MDEHRDSETDLHHAKPDPGPFHEGISTQLARIPFQTIRRIRVALLIGLGRLFRKQLKSFVEVTSELAPVDSDLEGVRLIMRQIGARAMSHRVEFSSAAKKQLKKMDRFDASLILSWIERNLGGCVDPRAFGKGLTANRTGEWRYRVGSYRVLAAIEDDRLVIELFKVGHGSTACN